jgi:hypothetical protein
MGMLQEFKEFAVKGNAMDLAVGVIIGGAFGKIVDSIVGDLIMPLGQPVVGKLDFSNLFVLGDNPNNLTPWPISRRPASRSSPTVQFPDHPGQFRHSRLHHFHDGQADESPAYPGAPGAGAGSAGDPGRCDAAARNSRFAEEINLSSCPQKSR